MAHFTNLVKHNKLLKMLDTSTSVSPSHSQFLNVAEWVFGYIKSHVRWNDLQNHQTLFFYISDDVQEITTARVVHSLFYFAYTCVRDLFIGGGIYLAKNIICDGILHVNMFHYFKISYFTCRFFTKFTYNEYVGLFFYRTLFYDFLPVISPSTADMMQGWIR
jgi:hypothetical protein